MDLEPPPPQFDPPPHGPVCRDCPNIVFSLTDDQDVELGGWLPMQKTRALLQDGAMLTNWRIHTPICSPSRSQTVSGRYFHNIKSPLVVPPPILQPAASGHVDGSLYTNQSFGVYLRGLKGYNVGMFGKSNFNTYEGFDRWFQGAFLGYGGKWEDNEGVNFRYMATKTNYSTTLLQHKAVEWLGRSNVTGSTSKSRPFFLYFAPHCPHTPATPEHQYEDACKGVGSPRTPSYNYTNDGFHELVARQPPLTESDAVLIDDLARRRCQCLMSVDDAHAALVGAVKAAGRWESTYWMVTSDHGYNLGQHRLPSNKFLLYDHAVRIPMLVRGPGIAAGNNSVLGTNVDYAPTWLGLAGIPTPGCMDGRSLLSQLVPPARESLLPPPTREHVAAERAGLRARPWRDAIFFQYYNQGGPNPWDGKPPGPWDAQGWAPGSSSNPNQRPADLGANPFPRDVGLNTTIRPLDDWSNTYIGLLSLDPSIGSGRYKYGEYEYQCSSAAIAERQCFSSTAGGLQPPSDAYSYQLFDLGADPHELHNIYEGADPSIVTALARKLRKYYPCQGAACP